MKYMKKDPVNEEVKVVFTHTALGTFQDSNGKWVLAKVEYNPETGDTGKLETISNEEGSREAINIRFRLEAVNLNLVG
jgi:hypothetical protein